MMPVYGGPMADRNLPDRVAHARRSQPVIAAMPLGLSASMTAVRQGLFPAIAASR
jgi:hypothetical protein